MLLKPMNTILSVQNEHLTRLNPTEAVGIFRKLLWAEARRIGLPLSKVHISTWINVPDGGIDAVVEDGTLASNDLIRSGLTGYQLKASDAFKPWQLGQIKKELFDKKTPKKVNLGSSIRDCLDKGGTYVLVCFRQEFTDKQRRDAVRHIKNYFLECEYPDPKVEVWGQDKLIGFIQSYIPLILELNGQSDLPFHIFKTWSRVGDMQLTFVPSFDFDQKAALIKETLRSTNMAKHLRIIGEAGIGKTRFVLETVRAEDIEPFVIYSKAAQFINSNLLFNVCRDENTHIIAVVDECSLKQAVEIWNQLQNLGSRVKLITIYNEIERRELGIDYPDIPNLSIEEIKRIILSYGIPENDVERWAEFVGSSPRFAHMIGWNLKYFPKDVIRSKENIYDRIIAGYDDPKSEEVIQRRRVLRHLALFKRFGYKGPVEEEAKAIAALVERADRNITWPRFQEIIKTLKLLKILQGENTLYITPQPLQIRMWIEWWDTYGSSFKLDEFLPNIPENIKVREWFYEMFKYAAESGAALRIVKDLLGVNGPFQNNDYLKTELGGRFFLALTEADPQSALRCLQKTVGRWSKDELLQFTTGRRQVVWALEMIAMWGEFFVDAARLLLALGEAENEKISNNASGVFIQLFSPATGKVAPTEASPQERFPVLVEAIESSSSERRLLALRACDQALESQHFVRSIGAEYQGLRKPPELWRPKTWGELFDAYRQVWQLLSERLDSFPMDERQETISIILKRASSLTGSDNLADMVFNTLIDLIQRQYVNKKTILANAIQMLRYGRNHLSEKTRERWKQLKDELEGTDFSSLMKRYVGMDLLEDKFDNEGLYGDQAESKIKELAQQALSNDLLEPELPWLVTTEAEKGFSFGYELGLIDTDFSQFPTLLNAQRQAGENSSVFFLSGYLRALRNRYEELWETLLDDLMNDEKLSIYIPEITLRCGFSDRAALRVLGLGKSGVIDPSHFGIFGYGSGIQDLSEKVFIQWIEFLLDSPRFYAISIALDLYDLYYLRATLQHPIPDDLTLKLLVHPSLFSELENGSRGQMDEYHWTQIGNTFIRIYPERSIELANIMLEHFGEEGTILDTFHSSAERTLDELARNHPTEIWMRAKKYLGPPIDSRAARLSRWLTGVLNHIPIEEIWQWVDEDVDIRAWYLASFMPNALFRSKGQTCIAREVLIRYGDREDVRLNFSSNYYSDTWWGPSSAHFESKKAWLLEFKKGENNENVNLWIDEFVEEMSRDIERARIVEERE
jgi:hypothetical protein